MKKQLFVTMLSSLIALISCSQINTRSNTTKSKILIGGACEGCEAIFESSISFDKINWIDTMPDYFEAEQKIEISGTIYKDDGKTPAPNIILYAYHTDQSGHYSQKGNETGWGRRHGYIRGWVKTNRDGKYKFLTNKPAAYPGRTDPAHIHLTLKEPDKNEYWIDEIVFDDDPLLTSEKRKLENRGGSGVIILSQKSNTLIGERNIYLGKNIPGYPLVK